MLADIILDLCYAIQVSNIFPLFFIFRFTLAWKHWGRHVLHYRETVSVCCFEKVNHQKRCRRHLTVFSFYYIALFMNIRENVTIEALWLDLFTPPSHSKTLCFYLPWEFPKNLLSTAFHGYHGFQMPKQIFYSPSK